MSGLERVLVLGVPDDPVGVLLQQARERAFRRLDRTVLGDHDRLADLGGQVGEQARQRLQAAPGGPDRDQFVVHAAASAA